MVKKLIKHELYAYFRSVWPLTIVALGLTALSGILMFSKNSALFWMLSIMIVIVLIYGMLSMLLGPIAKRFQTTMFKGEGYMTFSIPATPVQLIVSKLIAAMILWVYTALLFFLCAFVFSLTLESMIVSDSLQYWSAFFADFFDSIASDPLLFVEELIVLLVASVFGILFIFTGICVGQLFKTRKSMMSVLFFVVIFFLVLFCQTFLSDFYIWMDNINRYIKYLISFLVFAALAVVCFFSTKYIVTHKLNLVA